MMQNSSIMMKARQHSLRSRGRWLIAIAALFAHLAMPFLSRPAMAMSADPAMRAFCGHLSPAMLESVRRNAPELFELLRRDAQSCDKAGCPSCHLAHMNGPLGPDPALLTVENRGAHERIAGPAPLAPAVALVVLPQLRGPPVAASPRSLQNASGTAA